MMRARLEPAGFYRRLPLQPHQMQTRVTPTRDTIVLCHLGVPRLTAEAWRLDVIGLVERPLSLRIADLNRFRRVDVESVHQCAGSPLEPTVATRRVANVVWSGVPLAEILDAAGVRPEAMFVWSTGADHGVFSDVACNAYVKDLPLARVSEDVLLADRLNGEPLPAEHGFPVRLVVPGFYGTNSVKWLTRIELASRRADGPFTTRWYNDVVPSNDALAEPRRIPVWALAPEAVITTPAPEQIVPARTAWRVEGWTWADGGVAEVRVEIGFADHVLVADLERPVGRAWQRFTAHLPGLEAGSFSVSAVATAMNGQVQPAHGARNAVHRVPVVVR